jgi:hypothetical protein
MAFEYFCNVSWRGSVSIASCDRHILSASTFRPDQRSVTDGLRKNVCSGALWRVGGEKFNTDAVATAHKFSQMDYAYGGFEEP